MRVTPLALILLAACAPAPVVPAPGHPALTAAPAPATPARALAATSPLYAYDVTKLAEGVYAFAFRESKGSLVSGNTLVVIGDDGVLVVDTTHFPSLARKMIADIRKLTDKPVRFVVNTHWHPDHVFGNAAYREAFPGVTVLAHAETRRLTVKNDPKYVTTQQKSEKVLAMYRGFLASGKTSSGKPMTDDDRLEYAASLPEAEQTVGDTDVTLLAPDATFEGATMSVFLGQREVRLLHLGRGNTAGDVAVYVPDAKVLATGDLVVGPTPYAYGSYLGEWAECLRRLAATDAQVVMPGHGPIAHDFAYVRALTALIDSVRAQTARLEKAGVSVEDAKKQVDLAAEETRFAGDDPLRRYEFREGFVNQAVERGYEEAKGALSDE